jgi:chitin disaccharide deacetylase
LKRLIVTADDAGLDPGMTGAAIAAHRNGIVTACSVVANGVAFQDAVDRLRDAPTLETGAHLALVEERAITTGHPMSSGYRAFITGYLSGRITSGWIERELRAQIERLLEAGLRLRFVNGHQHLHALPRIFAIVVKLAEEYRIGYVRVPRERRVRGISARSMSVRTLGAIASRASQSAPAVDARNEATIGIAEAGHLDTTRLLRLLDDVADGVTELVTHPGLGVTSYAHWNYAWDVETAALCDPAVRRAIDDRGIVLIRPSDVSF